MRLARQGRDVRNEPTPDTTDAQETPLSPYVGAQEALDRELDRQRPFRVDRSTRFRRVTDEDNGVGHAVTEWDPYGPESRRR
jgi:hypothetical protein